MTSNPLFYTAGLTARNGVLTTFIGDIANNFGRFYTARTRTEMPGQGPIPSKPPRTKRMSLRSKVIALDGAESPYPVYRFSRRHVYEKPRHNPFNGL